MKISLVICAYNEENYIGRCLQSVADNSDSKFHEIIVVDNASTDRTKEVAGKFPGVKVLDQPKRGTNNARQKGFENATGDLVAFIDADTKMPKDWVDKAVDFFSKNKNVVGLSGPYKYYDGSKLKNFIIESLWWISAPISYRLIGYMVLGGNFIARRDALASIGGFDGSFEFYGDDTEVARRLSKIGRVVFRMDFFIYSSSRRFSKEGILKTSFNYAMNFIWPALFNRPFTKGYTDARIHIGKK